MCYCDCVCCQSIIIIFFYFFTIVKFTICLFAINNICEMLFYKIMAILNMFQELVVFFFEGGHNIH